MKLHKGETIASGVALGPIHLKGFEVEGDFPQRIPSDQVEDELNRLRSALTMSRQQIGDLKDHHGGSLGESELRIFDVHLDYLQDPMFVDKIEHLVLNERYSVRAAIRRVSTDYDRIFQLVEDDYLRQRAGDFRDVATRVLGNLDEGEVIGRGDVSPPEQRYVLAARRLTVNDLFKLDNERVEGIVAEEGGISSHAAILARSMGIPTISGIRDLPSKLQNGDFVILDAGSGEMHVDPDERLREEYQDAAERLKLAHEHAPDAEIAHETRDGTAVDLLSSCGNVAEVKLGRAFGMRGIGLYRTELMFFVENRLPSEDMLMHQYREVLKQESQGETVDAPVGFRLLDVAASSNVLALPPHRERNPALGARGVRSLLLEGNVLRLQLRAILRAAHGSRNVAVLVPFVSGVNELQRVKAAIVEERLELRKRGVECAGVLRVAPIIEVPAAVFVCDQLLNESDFLMVAIDDLQALMLAADRDNALVREHYQALHPALIEVIARMARVAERGDKPLVLFGEGAADPLRLPFYLGVGIRHYSIAPVNLKPMLEVLQRFTLDECRKIADELLEAPRSLDVQRVLVRLGS